MKNAFSALAFAAAATSTGIAHASTTTLLFEDFEDGLVTYTTSAAEFSDGFGDYFTRTDGSNIGSFVEIDNVQGSFFFGAQDIDGEGAPPLIRQTFTVNIAGYDNLVFSGLFGEDDDGSNEDWDLTDYVRITYSIDAGPDVNLIWFESIPDDDSFNAVPALDIDFDGNGDGPILTDRLSYFSAPIVGTGNTIDIEIAYALNSGDEDIAVDNIRLVSVPTPGAVAGGVIGLAALAGRRRKA